jgi:phage protein D
MAAPYQGNRRRAAYKIVCGPLAFNHVMRDVTEKHAAHLISIQICERLGEGEQDTASIELDDRYGMLAIPPDQTTIEIYLGWINEYIAIVFDGYVTECESGCFRRGGGRRLWIEARSTDTTGGARTMFRNSWGDGEGSPVSLNEVLQQSAGAAGLAARVSPSMANINRKFWAQENESFQHIGERLAGELGGLFKIVGKQGIFVNATDGMSGDGNRMGTVEAEWGVNMIGWRIKPFAGRPQAQIAQGNFFNKAKGLWGMAEQMIGGSPPFGGGNAVAGQAGSAANQETSEQEGEGMSQGSQEKRGVGSVTINGEPMAKVHGTLKVTGARAGVDGSYQIAEVEHNYSRSSGYITRISLRNPNPDGPPTAYGPEWLFPSEQQRRDHQQQTEDEIAERAEQQEEREAEAAGEERAPPGPEVGEIVDVREPAA